MKDRNVARAHPDRLWAGADEAIFKELPQTILANFYSPRSENALLWNLIYPRANPSIDLHTLLDIEPLWGTAGLRADNNEALTPYFWSFHLDGSRMPALEQTLADIDGAGPRTEVDLFLLGTSSLITVEVKHAGGFGRCSRYTAGHCPEVYPDQAEGDVCRYWEAGPGRFVDYLSLGDRPGPDQVHVLCNTHYQLARTYLVGKALAQKLDRRFALWIFLPKKRWRSLQPGWLDFVERVKDDLDWRWMRVIAWEDIQKQAPR